MHQRTDLVRFSRWYYSFLMVQNEKLHTVGIRYTDKELFSMRTRWNVWQNTRIPWASRLTESLETKLLSIAHYCSVKQWMNICIQEIWRSQWKSTTVKVQPKDSSIKGIYPVYVLIVMLTMQWFYLVQLVVWLRQSGIQNILEVEKYLPVKLLHT